MLRRIIFSITVFLVFTLNVIAQIPNGYYSTAEGKVGVALKTALYNTIKSHTVRTYSNLWTDFQTTDKRADGYVWDIYSSCNLIFVTNQDNGTGGNTECDKYNREHSFPNSWFGGDQASPMYTDLFHLYPTDKKVNNVRSNFIYGKVQTASYTSSNGSKLGSSDPITGFSGTVFEPVDDYKGDLARSYFYMATSYEDKIASWTLFNTDGLAILDGTSFPAYKAWYVQLLLSWCSSDPVSQKEINRNNAIYTIQGNRNPYIDHPEYAQAVWGVGTIISNEKITPLISIYPNPARDVITIEVADCKTERLEISNIVGKRLMTQSFKGEKQTIDISDFKPGVYFVSLIGVDFRKTSRIIVY